jgi:predicted enzyme related to lactoylglutathione lyase
MKKRVTGLGGVFFKSNDPKAQREWYAKHLGIESTEWGATFDWREKDQPDTIGQTAWNPFKADTKYFDPSTKDYMFNYRVENLVELLEELKKEGIQQVGELQVYDYGKFAHIMDPEGNKIELWEPIGTV